MVVLPLLHLKFASSGPYTHTAIFSITVPVENILRESLTKGSGFELLSSEVVRRPTSQRKPDARAASISIKCEQGTKEGSGVDVWLGRFAMIGFAAAIGTEVTTGRGVLENFGLTSPLPTVALAVAGLVGVLTAIFIFQSASKE
ncbi:hypothetical protein ACHQM5_016064 [Ranunculus cassubicifolius]